MFTFPASKTLSLELTCSEIQTQHNIFHFSVAMAMIAPHQSLILVWASTEILKFTVTMQKARCVSLCNLGTKQPIASIFVTAAQLNTDIQISGLISIFNPRRACTARVTILGLCVCVSVCLSACLSVCVCLLLNISLFTRLFMPQMILTSAADERQKF